VKSSSFLAGGVQFPVVFGDLLEQISLKVFDFPRSKTVEIFGPGIDLEAFGGSTAIAELNKLYSAQTLRYVKEENLQQERGSYTWVIGGRQDSDLVVDSEVGTMRSL
jgi:hypothetical protein